MAKGYGLTGKIRGKLGSKVYRIEAGEQIISEYAATKQDRKSNKQIMQRSKVTLANQISRQFRWEELVGLSTNRSKARRMFVGNVIKHTTAVIEDESRVTATADLTALQFSVGGNVLVDAQSINKVSQSGTVVNALMTFNEQSGVVRYLLLCLPVRDIPNPVMGAFEDAFVGMSEEVTAGQVCRATAVMNPSVVATGYHIYAYAVPFIPNTLKKRVIYSELFDTSVAGEVSVEALVELARADIYGATIYLGNIAF